jgi:hypothetical protein
MAGFQCSHAARDLCFESGSCAALPPASFVCACPDPNFAHDLSFFHDPNCSLPADAYMYNLIVCSIMCAVCIGLVLPRIPRASGNVKGALTLTVVNLVWLWLVAVASYAQGGWYEAAIVAQLIQLVVFSASGYLLLQILLLPIFSMDPFMVVRVKRGVRMFCVLTVIVQACPILAMLAACRDPDAALYNRAAVAFYFQFALLMWIALALLLKGAAWLERALKSTLNRNGDIVELRVRVTRIKTVIRYLFPQFVPYVIWPTVHCVLGSAPYHWTQQFLGFSIVFPMLATSFAVLLVKHQRDGTKTTESRFVTVALASAVRAKSRDILIQRAGRADFIQESEAELAAELEQGVLISDDGESLNILGQLTVEMDESDTWLHHWAPVTTSALNRVAARIFASKVLIAMVAGSSLCVTVLSSCILTQVLNQWLGLILVPLGAVQIVVFLLTVNRLVFKRLLQTSFLLWRLLLATLCAILFAYEVGDARMMISFEIWLCLMLTYASDAFVGRFLRMRAMVVTLTLVYAATIVALMCADLIPSSTYIVTISAAFDYSIGQLLRDLLFGHVVFLSFELSAVVRGSTNRRLLHLGNPVTFSIVELREGEDVRRRDKLLMENQWPRAGEAGASRLVLQSGFLAVNDDIRGEVEAKEKGSAAPVKVFVNAIVLKQEDAVFIHVLGFHWGKRAFLWATQGNLYVIGLTLLWVLNLVVLCTFPYSKPVALLGIPMGLILTIRSVGLSSLNMLRLLVKRSSFGTSILFFSAWLGMCVASLRDERIAGLVPVIALFVSELLVDARLAPPSIISRIAFKFTLALWFIAFSGQCAMGTIAFADSTTDMRPDTAASRIAAPGYPDSISVVDYFQTQVDLGFSLGLNLLLPCVVFVWRNKPTTFQQVTSPISPRYVNSSG